MTAQLIDGDYVADGHGGIRRCEGAAALLAEALFRLACRRGSFPLLPELGSALWTLPREKPSARNMLARQYAAEALDGLALTVEDAEVTLTEDGTALIRVLLRAEDETYALEVSL